MTSLQERLFAMKDKQYAAFQAKLTPGVPMESFIGIRVPVLRKFAKEFTKEAECKEFLQQLPHEYYDENMLHGLRLICERFLPQHMDAFDESIARSLSRTAVVRITLTEPPIGKRKQYDKEGVEMKYGRME